MPPRPGEEAYYTKIETYYPRTGNYLSDTKDILLKFFQKFFYEMPTDQNLFHFEPGSESLDYSTAETETELIITDGGSINTDTLEKRPAIIISRGPFAYANTSMDQLLSVKASNAKRTHTDLVTGSFVINCISSVEKAEQSATHDHILVIKELTPSDTAQIDHSLVKGFATEVGSYTSHAAIIARSLGLPAVVGIRGLSHQLHTGNTILIDGYEGLVILDPSAETLSNYKHLKKEKNKVVQKLQEARFEDPVTKDGRSITLSANIEFAYEALHAKENGAQGVGLFRTEFFYLNSKGLPDEDTQEQIYSKVSNNLAPDTLIIRTVDIGGDKIPSEDNEIELNPFLGWRGIRISLDRPEMFKTQLRAILRSAHSSSIGIMFPMISTIYELRYAKQLLEEVECDLDNEGIPYGKPREVGAMIEVPSAALLSSQLAKEVDFFSVGTNDLVQYTLAVDRINENVSDLYQPANPAVIKLLDQTVRSGHDEGIWVGVCGEMASDLLLTPLLLGLGFDEFSVGSPQVPAVKYALRKLNYRECKEMAKEAIKCGDEEAVLNLCREIANTTYPEIIN